MQSPDALRPRPCDPATNEAGCGDAAPAVDAVVPDAALPDATPDAAPDASTDASTDAGLDGATDGGADASTDGGGGPGDGGGGDGLRPDGGLTPIDRDLTGTYAVTRVVELTNDDRFTEGDVAHFIANLTRLADRSHYRLDLIDPEGRALTSEVALDFRAPEGPLNYQYRYERPVPEAPPECLAGEETFERGEVDEAAPEVTLTGEQIVHQRFEGEACAEADRLTNFSVRWVRIPMPEPPPPGDGGVGDAGATDAAASDAAAPDAAAADAGAADAGPADALRPAADAR